jgi:hypothetical protein
MPDIDLDFADRLRALDVIKHIDASLDGTFKKHNTGVYCTSIPYNPITGMSTLDYKTAEDRGYFKIDFLNVSVYDGVKDKAHLTQLLETDTNYKDKLLQYYHIMNWGDPKYGVMDTIIDNSKLGKKYFKVYVRDNDKNIIGSGIGSSKQKGEKLAAKRALQNLKVIPNDNEDEVISKTSDIIYYRKNK